MTEPATTLSFRPATRADVPTLVALLADDVLGARRERLDNPLQPVYYDAFEAIDADPNNILLVAENADQIVGMLQITFIPSLTYQGGWRALIEGVRVAASARGQGIGKALLTEAIGRAQARGCHLMQLTTDKTRTDAHAFYEDLGFRATHEGMKLYLTGTDVM